MKKKCGIKRTRKKEQGIKYENDYCGVSTRGNKV